jgi:nuclear RNA export factor
MAPRGKNQPAREGRNPLGAKSSSRGGIQKRRGPTKTDNDGDLDMDAPSKRLNRGSANETSGRGRPSGRGPPGRGPQPSRGAAKVAQIVMKQLGSGNSSDLSARVSRPTKSRGGYIEGLTWLRIRGLKQSKAASNPDGGLSDLLSFMERKASSLSTGRRRRMTIRKVSSSLTRKQGCQHQTTSQLLEWRLEDKYLRGDSSRQILFRPSAQG